MEFKKEDLIKSPLNYSGSKFRLIKKGLINYFPNNINTFVDLFCGACNVGINVNAKNIICNDYINYLPLLYNTWKIKGKKNVNEYIDKQIKNFKLSENNNDSFLEFRKYYNKTKNIEDLFILICYSFNYQMRFNNNQEYNSSFGKTASTMNTNIRKNLDIFIDNIINKDIKFVNYDFRELKINKLSRDDFVYCDPPYSISGAVYQDGKRGFKGWNKNDDKDLFNLLDKLNDRNIKFALSNMIESKGNKNIELIKWSKKYNVHNLEMEYNNSNYQRKYKGKDMEVLITNY